MSILKGRIKSKISGRDRIHSIKQSRRISAKPKTKNTAYSAKKPAFGLGIRPKGSPRPKTIKAASHIQTKKKGIMTKVELDKKIESEAQKKEYKIAAKQIIDGMLADGQSSDYLERMVSQKAKDVIALLSRPRSDEEIAKKLDIKINTIRRILNVLQGFGVTNYSISKSKDGWLSFVWEIDTKKAGFFTDYINSGELKTDIVTDSCNDYFVCDKCYKENRLILTFDAAYESNFKCVCEKNLSQVTKEQVSTLILKAKD